jgi:hypothetical protein
MGRKKKTDTSDSIGGGNDSLARWAERQPRGPRPSLRVIDGGAEGSTDITSAPPPVQDQPAASSLSAELGVFGLDTNWMQSEERRLTEHLQQTGQPLGDAVRRLWLGRRVRGACPVGARCRRVKAGQIFCALHAAVRAAIERGEQ